MPFTLVTIPFDQSTPNLIDPADNGAFIAAVPAGSYVDVAILGITAPDEPGNGTLALLPDPSSSGATGPVIGNEANISAPSNALGTWRPYAPSGVVSPNAFGPTMKAIVACNLYLAWYSDSTPTTVIAGEIVCKIYS